MPDGQLHPPARSATSTPAWAWTAPWRCCTAWMTSSGSRPSGPLVVRLEELSGRSYADKPEPFRIIADHLRAATFAIADGASPSNVEAGYVVRRMIRRAVRYGRELGIQGNFCADFSGTVVDLFAEVYPELAAQRRTGCRGDGPGGEQVQAHPGARAAPVPRGGGAPAPGGPGHPAGCRRPSTCSRPTAFPCP